MSLLLMRNYLSALLLLAGLVCAAEVTMDVPQASSLARMPVAIVNGQAIGFGELEKAVLRTEITSMKEEISKRIDGIDLAAMPDGQQVLPMTRGQMTVVMLRAKGARVREDLIDLRLVEQAVVAAGLRIDEKVEADELERLQQRLDEGLEKGYGKVRMDLRTMIQNNKDMTLERWMKEREFRTLMGVDLLLDRQVERELGDVEIAAWKSKNLDRCRKGMAIDVSVIFLSYILAGPDGRPVHDPTAKTNLATTMRTLYDNMRAGRLSFESVWNGPMAAAFRKHHPDARADGRIGWVQANGTRETDGGRGISRATAEKALALQGPYPLLLEPADTGEGIELVQVQARRAANELPADEIARLARRDTVETQIKPRTDRLIKELRSTAIIDYGPGKGFLVELIAERAKMVGLAPQGGFTGKIAP